MAISKIVSDVLGNINTCDFTKDLTQYLYNEIKTYPVNRDKNPYINLTLGECRKLTEYEPLATDTFKGGLESF